MHITVSNEIRVRLARLGRSQDWLSKQIGMDPTLFSRVLRGLRPTSADFHARVEVALSRHEAAERAAATARARVLNAPNPKGATRC